jgi:hypothetical protein
MHQAGIENVVANSGTALSVFQIHLLRRFTQNITLLYDGDEACASVPSSLRDLFLCRLLAGAMPLPGRLVLTIVFCRPYGTFCRSLPAA